MEWLDRHHVAVVRTATGVVLVASAITGVVGSMTFHDLAKDNAAKQAQIDALAHQLQQHPTALPSASAEAGPTGGSKVVAQPYTSPSPGATVLLLANAQNEPVVPAGHGGPHVPLGGTSATAHPTGTPTARPTRTRGPKPSPTSEGPLSSLVDSASGTLKQVVAPLDPKPQPSQTPLAVFLVPALRRNS